MIEKICDESYYRKSSALSYSNLKLFDNNPMHFYKEVILGEKVDREISEDMIMGNLVDCRLLDLEAYSDKFCLASVNKPTGQKGDLVDRLVRFTKLYTDEDGVVQESFELLFEHAFEEAKSTGQFKGKTKEKVLGDFMESGKDFYDECRRAIGKCVIDINQLQNSERVINKLKTSSVSSHIVNLESNENREVLNQFPIFFTYRGIEMRSLLDKMVVNHNKKIISIWDLKCTKLYNNFGFSYLQQQYYIQQALYWTAVNEWAKEYGFHNYDIQPVRFLAIHLYGHYDPIIWKCNGIDIEKGLKGFSTPYRKYRGVDELQDRITFAIENDCWDRTMEAYKNNGVLPLEIEYV